MLGKLRPPLAVVVTAVPALPAPVRRSRVDESVEKQVVLAALLIANVDCRVLFFGRCRSSFFRALIFSGPGFLPPASAGCRPSGAAPPGDAAVAAGPTDPPSSSPLGVERKVV